jgi:hypothetical protein
LAKYALQVDNLYNQVQVDAPDIANLKSKVEEAKLNNPAIHQANYIISNHLDDDKVPSTIREVIGVVEAPNKPALLDFISKVDTLGKMGKSLTAEDKTLMVDLEKLFTVAAPDDAS